MSAKGSDGKPYVGIMLGVSNYAQFPAQFFAPGTVAVYRYRQPDGRSYIYAFGEAENNLLKQNPVKFERVAFYVWAEAQSGARLRGRLKSADRPRFAVSHELEIHAGFPGTRA